MSSMGSIVFGMFAVTFGIRFVLYARAHRIVMPVWIEEALRFVPVAVLTAIIVPMVFMPNSQLTLNWQSPWLLGALAAFLVGMVRQQPMLTIATGVLVFFTAKIWPW